MDTLLAQKAVNLALSGNWQDAIDVNLEIISSDPNNVDALNRLARCYAEVGESQKATETTKKVLSLDPNNSIAQKCLIKWRSNKTKVNGSSPLSISAEAFLEEPGKTKMITLVNLGCEDVFACLDSGSEVKLQISLHRVNVVDSTGKYIGRLPDDLAARIKDLLKKGNKYQILVKSVDTKEITIFVRELENKSGLISFPAEKIEYVSFTPPELVHKDVPEMTNIEDPLE